MLRVTTRVLFFVAFWSSAAGLAWVAVNDHVDYPVLRAMVAAIGFLFFLVPITVWRYDTR